jgi:hypothetical protein
MFILDFFLAVFALAPFGPLVLFWKAFHEDRGVHPIYRNAKTETANKTEIQDITQPIGIRSKNGNRIGQNSVVVRITAVP